MDKWVRCFFLLYSSYPCRCPCVRTAAAAKKGNECEEVCVRPRLHSVTKGTGGSEGFLFTGSVYCLLSPETSAYKCPVLAYHSVSLSTFNQTIEGVLLLLMLIHFLNPCFSCNICFLVNFNSLNHSDTS